MKAWLTQAPAEEDEEGEPGQGLGRSMGVGVGGAVWWSLSRWLPSQVGSECQNQEGGRRRAEERAGVGIRSGAGSVAFQGVCFVQNRIPANGTGSEKGQDPASKESR